VVILTEYGPDLRIVPFSDRHGPPEQTPPTGDSIAHWEGDTLVIETVGQPDSNRIHMFPALLVPGEATVIERLANLATKTGVEGEVFTIHAPLQHMTKADIVREAQRLGLDAALSHSCYDPLPDGRHCGQCDACRLRAKGFAEAGVEDPTGYA